MWESFHTMYQKSLCWRFCTTFTFKDAWENIGNIWIWMEMLGEEQISHSVHTVHSWERLSTYERDCPLMRETVTHERLFTYKRDCPLVRETVCSWERLSTHEKDCSWERHSTRERLSTHETHTTCKYKCCRERVLLPSMHLLLNTLKVVFNLVGSY